METNLRRALALAQGNWTVLFSTPLTIGLWVMVLGSILLPLLTRRTRVAELGPAAATREDEDAPPLND
jgi:putative tricarboxylic transport membrane protein